MSGGINTKQVKGRRPVHYNTYKDLMDDVFRVAPSHKTLGNWSLAQICDHLARSFRLQVKAADIVLPWSVSTFARLFLKRRFLTKSLPAGFSIPSKHVETLVASPDLPLTQAIANLEQVIEQCKETRASQPHPLLGKLNREEWEAFNLRHAEMHMSFVLSQPSPRAK